MFAASGRPSRDLATIATWLLLLFVCGRGATAEEFASSYPKWSWDRVPVYLHFGSHTQLSDDQVKTAASISNFICLEKAHGSRSDREFPERVMGQDARRLKQINPEAKVLFYWNALIAWPFTSYNREFEATHPRDWILRDQSTGVPLLKSTLGETPVYQYNLLNPETRAWWATVSANAVKQFGFDGVFMDAVTQGRRPLLLNRGWGKDKGEELDSAAIEMMKTLRSAMGNDRLLIYNGLRTHHGEVDAATAGGSKFLPWSDGVIIEHFDQFGSSTKEDILTYWKMASEASAQGKIVIFKAWPDHDANFTSPEFKARGSREREQFARERITFPLACYLIGAQEHSYFCYGWGYDVEDGQLLNYPEYRYRLGAPMHDGRRDGQSWVFTREFEHASVWLDLERRDAKIQWKSADASGSVRGKQADTEAKVESKADTSWDPLRQQVMDLSRLTNAPQMHPVEGWQGEARIRPIYYDALPWQGQQTRVFGWLGFPDSTVGTSDAAKLPAVVLVHGGGGTAFREWVQKWNEHGFAALSIAVEGQTDERDATGRGWKRHQWAGPARNGIYGDSDEPLGEQWMYHAVADTILAHSLLRAHPQVDPEKVGLVGISWGGVITSTVIGIDPRFSFAIPIYGCGDLAEVANQYGRALGGNELYRNVWDPMVRIGNVRSPTLWLSWTGDQHFPLDSLKSCYEGVTGAHTLALLPEMGHGHASGWNPPDSYAFAKSIVDSGEPWCQQLAMRRDGGRAWIRFRSSKAIEKARLVSTKDRGFTGRRNWTELPADFTQEGEQVIVKVMVPEETTGWFVNLQSGPLTASSDYQERDES